MAFKSLSASILVVSVIVLASSLSNRAAGGDLPPLVPKVPDALEKITACMVETARAMPNVIVATRGVKTERTAGGLDKIVFVRLETRTGNGVKASAEYGRSLNDPLEQDPEFHFMESYKEKNARFTTWEAERKADAPISAVAAAWRAACGVLAYVTI
jgi:hypothetical protein